MMLGKLEAGIVERSGMEVGVLGTVRAQKERSGMVVGTVEGCWGSCGLRWARSRVLGIVRAQKEAGDRAG